MLPARELTASTSIGSECPRAPDSLGLESQLLKPNVASTYVTLSRGASSNVRKRLIGLENQRASSAVSNVLEISLKITVSCLHAFPSVQIALKITVVTCATHQQQFKKQLAPWSETGGVFDLRPFRRSGVPLTTATQLPKASTNASRPASLTSSFSATCRILIAR